MDVSKLRKLSDTQSQLPATAQEGGVPPTPAIPVARDPMVPDYAMPPTTLGLAETWISVGVGFFLLFFYPRFLQWASSRMFHTHFDEFLDNNTGAVVPYQTLGEFWSDLGPTLLGVVLIVDGLLLFTRKPMLILIALVLTFISTVFNAGWVLYSFNKYGFAPISFLAAVFGGFILSTQWLTYKRITYRRSNPI